MDLLIENECKRWVIKELLDINKRIAGYIYQSLWEEYQFSIAVD
jgi:hypothetical protein